MDTGTEVISNINKTKRKLQQSVIFSFSMSIVSIITIIFNWSYWKGLMGIPLLIIVVIWIVTSSFCYYYTDKLFKELPI